MKHRTAAWLTGLSLLLIGSMALGADPIAKGIDAYWADDFARAEMLLREGQRGDLLDTERILAGKFLAMTLVARDKPVEAEAEFGKILDLDLTYSLDPETVPPNVLEFFNRAKQNKAKDTYRTAMELYGVGSYSRSARLLEEVLLLDPGHPSAPEFLLSARERRGPRGSDERAAQGEFRHETLKMGPVGGVGGKSFEDVDIPNALATTVIGVRVFSGRVMDQVQMIHEFRGDSARRFELERHGGRGGDEDTFYLEPGEYITRVTGRYGMYVDSIMFHTNLGRSSKEFGGGGGDQSYSFDAPTGYEVAGFCGREAKVLDAIGVVVRTRPDVDLDRPSD